MEHIIEKQYINGKEVWVEVQAKPAGRENSHVIPTEYFTVRYYLEDPKKGVAKVFTNEDGEPKLFESPVAALTFASKNLMTYL
jgi:hypothetical protein